MAGTQLMFRKEWIAFCGSEKSVFAIYAVLVVLWSMVFMSTGSQGTAEVYIVWLLSFSVVVGSNFSQTVFVAERISGSLEILLTSGLSRGEILIGKALFVCIMSTAMGLLCMLLSALWPQLIPWYAEGQRTVSITPFSIGIYAAATLMNTASAAWLSVLLSNPRMLHFVNFVFMGIALGVFFAFRSVIPLPLWVLPVFLLLLSGLFYALAWHGYQGETIVRPVSL